MTAHAAAGTYTVGTINSRSGDRGASENARMATMQAVTVVYTALFGGYDKLQEPAYSGGKCDFVCFTDDESLTSYRWKIVVVPATMSAALMNRHVKLQPHLYFADYETSVYVDANLKILKDPTELARKYLAASVFAAPRHHLRSCVYDEIETCMAAGKVDKEAGQAQIERYRAAGYPEGNGLSENRVLVRRHHDPAVRALMEAWWKELLTGVERDQACLQVVCWRQGFAPEFMTENVICGEYFEYRPHKNERLIVRLKMYALVAWMKLTGGVRRLLSGARR